MTIGEVIKTVRTQLDLSQAKFAEIVNVEISTVSKWENDKTLPKSKSKKLLSDFMRKHNISEEWIEIIGSVYLSKRFFTKLH